MSSLTPLGEIISWHMITTPKKLFRWQRRLAQQAIFTVNHIEAGIPVNYTTLISELKKIFPEMTIQPEKWEGDSEKRSPTGFSFCGHALPSSVSWRKDGGKKTIDDECRWRATWASDYICVQLVSRAIFVVWPANDHISNNPRKWTFGFYAALSCTANRAPPYYRQEAW